MSANETSEKPSFTAEELALVSNEGLAPAERLSVLTALAHGTEAERAEYAARQGEVLALQRQLSGDAGSAIQSGGTTPTPETQARIAQIDARMREIARDIHVDTEEARRRFAANETEYYRLAAERVALERGKTPSPARSEPKSVAKAAVAKVNITDYLAEMPRREDGTQRSWVDDRILGSFLPVAHELQLMPAAVERIVKWYCDSEEEFLRLRQEEAAEAAESTRADAEEALEHRYGARWRERLAPTNAFLRRILPDGKSQRLMQLQLADGTVLGSHPLAVEAFIEIARELGRRW